VLDVLVHSKHLWVCCVAKKNSARSLCKDTIHRYWKDTTDGGDLGQSARNRVSRRDCGFSTRLVPVLFFGFPDSDDPCIVQE
jgi:hypothetical protein